MIWILRRIVTSIVLAWVVVTIVFLSLHAIPGDPAELLLSADNGLVPDPAAVAELRRTLGLDQPILTQYQSFLGKLSRADLGESLLDGYPVVEEIALRLPRTLELIVAATLISLVFGMSLGTFAAVRQGGMFDKVATGIVTFLQSTPIFVFGTVPVLIFAQTLHWMPAGGFVAFSVDPVKHLTLLALPAISTSARQLVDIYRMMRVSVLDVLSRDYIRTGRAKGLSQGTLLRRHVVRAALIPVVTLVGMDMGAMLGGTVLVEYIFNWPGLSAPLMRSISARDYPMVAGIVLTISLLFLLLNLLTDLLYSAIDPRVKA